MLMKIMVWCACRANSGGMTFRFRWLNVQRDGALLALQAIYRARRTVSCTWRREGGQNGWTRGGTSVRKEPNKERKVGLIGCRRRNLVVSICHSVARETRLRCLGPLRASLSFALSPFFLALSTSDSPSSSFSIRFDSRGIYLWIRRSRRFAWTLAGYYENSRAPSNLPGIRSTYPGGRAKNPTTAARSPSCRRAPLVRATSDWDSRDTID